MAKVGQQYPYLLHEVRRNEYEFGSNEFLLTQSSLKLLRLWLVSLQLLREFVSSSATAAEESSVKVFLRSMSSMFVPILMVG